MRLALSSVSWGKAMSSNPKIAGMQLKTPLYKKAACLSWCGQGACLLGVGATLLLPLKMRAAPLWGLAGVVGVSAIAYGVMRSQEKFLEVEAEAQQDVHAYYLAHYTADRVRQIEAHYLGLATQEATSAQAPETTPLPSVEIPDVAPTRGAALVKASKGGLN